MRTPRYPEPWHNSVQWHMNRWSWSPAPQMRTPFLAHHWSWSPVQVASHLLARGDWSWRQTRRRRRRRNRRRRSRRSWNPSNLTTPVYRAIPVDVRSKRSSSVASSCHIVPAGGKPKNLPSAEEALETEKDHPPSSVGSPAAVSEQDTTDGGSRSPSPDSVSDRTPSTGQSRSPTPVTVLDQTPNTEGSRSPSPVAVLDQTPNTGRSRSPSPEAVLDQTPSTGQSRSPSPVAVLDQTPNTGRSRSPSPEAVLDQTPSTGRSRGPSPEAVLDQTPSTGRSRSPTPVAVLDQTPSTGRSRSPSPEAVLDQTPSTGRSRSPSPEAVLDQTPSTGRSRSPSPEAVLDQPLNTEGSRGPSPVTVLDQTPSTRRSRSPSPEAVLDQTPSTGRSRSPTPVAVLDQTLNTEGSRIPSPVAVLDQTPNTGRSRSPSPEAVLDQTPNTGRSRSPSPEAVLDQTQNNGRSRSPSPEAVLDQTPNTGRSRSPSPVAVLDQTPSTGQSRSPSPVAVLDQTPSTGRSRSPSPVAVLDQPLNTEGSRSPSPVAVSDQTLDRSTFPVALFDDIQDGSTPEEAMSGHTPTNQVPVSVTPSGQTPSKSGPQAIVSGHVPDTSPSKTASSPRQYSWSCKRSPPVDELICGRFERSLSIDEFLETPANKDITSPYSIERLIQSSTMEWSSRTTEEPVQLPEGERSTSPVVSSSRNSGSLSPVGDSSSRSRCSRMMVTSSGGKDHSNPADVVECTSLTQNGLSMIELSVGKLLQSLRYKESTDNPLRNENNQWPRSERPQSQFQENVLTQKTVTMRSKNTFANDQSGNSSGSVSKDLPPPCIVPKETNMNEQQEIIPLMNISSLVSDDLGLCSPSSVQVFTESKTPKTPKSTFKEDMAFQSSTTRKTDSPGNTSSNNVPAGKTSSNNVPAGNTSSNNVPAGNTSSNNVPAGNTSSNNVPAGNTSSNNVPAGNTSSNNVPEDIPRETLSSSTNEVTLPIVNNSETSAANAFNIIESSITSSIPCVFLRQGVPAEEAESSSLTTEQHMSTSKDDTGLSSPAVVCSSTLNTSRSPSPVAGSSPTRGRSTSPSPVAGSSPTRGRSTSPSPVAGSSPTRGRSTSPSPVAGSSPTRGRSTSPSPVAGSSPTRGRSTSPSPVGGSSPTRGRSTSPLPVDESLPVLEGSRSPSPDAVSSPSLEGPRSPSPVEESSSVLEESWGASLDSVASVFDITSSLSPDSSSSPTPVRSRSPSPVGVSSPTSVRSRSPSPVGVSSPTPVKSRSPSPAGVSSPTPVRSRSPSPVGVPSPTPVKSRSPLADGLVPPLTGGSRRVSPVFRSTSQGCRDLTSVDVSPPTVEHQVPATPPTADEDSLEAIRGGYGRIYVPQFTRKRCISLSQDSDKVPPKKRCPFPSVTESVVLHQRKETSITMSPVGLKRTRSSFPPDETPSTNQSSKKCRTHEPSIDPADLLARLHGGGLGLTPTDTRSNAHRNTVITRAATQRLIRRSPNHALLYISNKRMELFKAVENGDLDCVQELIQDTGPAIRRDVTNCTLLHTAATYNQLDIVMFLLKLIGPNVVNKEGQTPAHLAALKGHTQVLRILLADHQLNHNKRDNNNRTYKDLLSASLFEAVVNSDRSRVQELLKLGADPDYHADSLVDGVLERELQVTTARQLALTLHREAILRVFPKEKPTEEPIEIAPSLSFSPDSVDLEGTPDNQLFQSLRLMVRPALTPALGPDAYRMDTDPKGYVCILGYSSFEDRPDLQLEGSHPDVQNLANVFGNMGYTGHAHFSLTADQTKQVLTRVRDMEELERAGCAIFIISSHGTGEGKFLTSDMKLLTTEFLCDLFKDSECPRLKNKPKLFIFDFCCGYYKNQSPRQGSTGKGTRVEEPLKDMMCLYSSSGGFTSYTFTKDGTPFTMALCRTLEQHAHDKEFDDLYREFLKEYSKTSPATIPHLRNIGFTKRFYFSPVTRKL
ncbi:uncharacterized protein [Panulirus ornatus]